MQWIFPTMNHQILHQIIHIIKRLSIWVHHPIQKSKIELKKSRSASSVASQSSSHLSQSKQSEHSPKHVIIFSMSMYIAYTLSAWIFVFTTLENGIIGDCAGVGISGFTVHL
eukprot:357058_1